MIQLAYLSSTPTPLTDEVIREILVKSRRNNSRDDITGLLVYHDGNVLQFLEGDKERVDKLYERISRDPRHRGLIRLYEKQIESRDFPEWNMGFNAVRREDLKELEGYSDVLRAGFDLSQLSGKAAQTLVTTFKRSARDL